MDISHPKQQRRRLLREIYPPGNTRRDRRTPRIRMIQALQEGLRPPEYENLNRDTLFATRFRIKNKEGRIVRFVMNKAQHHYDQNRGARNIIVKARQLGFSTYEQARIYEAVALREETRGVNAVTIANQGDNTSHVVGIFDRLHNNMPPGERSFRRGGYPHAIQFPERDSTVHMGTAGNRVWGRSFTAHMIHCSEIAFWPDARTIMDALMEVVPPQSVSSSTSVTMESTTNGIGGYFYEEVQKCLSGGSDWRLHFYTWWWAPEYRIELAPGERIDYTDEEQGLIDRVFREEGLLLEPAQVMWRRSKIRDRQAKFFQEYPEDIATCFLFSGRPRFNNEALMSRINSQARDPIFQDYPVYEEGTPFYRLRIYKKPQKGHAYVIGADTSEGIQVSDSDTDNSAAVIRDYRTNEQVATIHGKLTPFEFAFLLHEIGRLYNNALIGVERNNHGHAVLAHLVWGTNDGSIHPYESLYVHEDKRLGWLTSSATRPVMIDDLANEYAVPESYIVRDKAILREGLSFVIYANGKAAASQGSHDDLVIADAIAGQLRVRPTEEREPQYNPVQIGDF